MGYLREIANLTTYATLYTFSTANMSLGRDFGRRESVMVIPNVDSVLDGYGRFPGPLDRRDFPVSFLMRTTDGNIDRAYDLLAAAVAPGVPVQLVWLTDSGALWYTVGSNPRIQNTHDSERKYGRGGAGGHLTVTVTWRIRPDWRPRYPQADEERYSALDNEVYTSAGNEVYLAPGWTGITAADQFFTLDNTGTAGYDLPTLPDTGPSFTLVGPCGGDSGIRVKNFTATATDPTGVDQPLYFDIPFKLPTANDSATLEFAAQSFRHNGLGFRPTKPSYQREYMRVMAGVVNTCVVSGLGANILTGGSVSVNYWKRRA